MKNFWESLPRPIIALAPMEGITDSAFRRTAREYGADVVYTEFISSDAIDRSARTALAKMEYDPIEQPVVCQIFGRDVGAFKRAAKIVEARGFAGIDINFGCPARKVVRNGGGVALMRNPLFARRLIEVVLDAVRIPVSIKLRSSIRCERREIQPDCPDRYTALDVVEAISDLPLAAIMIHGRSFENPFAAEIDVTMIRAVQERFSGTVLANGGILTPEDAERMLNQTGAHGIAIARGALGKPWIFSRLRQALRPAEPHPDVYDRAIPTIILEHAQRAAKKDKRALVEFRKHLSWYIRGVNNAARLRARLSSVNTLDDVRQVVSQAFPV